MMFRGAADRAAVERRLVRYVDIHSVNPAIDGLGGEAALGTTVYEDLAALGLDPQRQPVGDAGRDNIIARLPGAPGSPTVMFEAHLDTVGLSGSALAAASVRHGAVYGRGACDTKGSLTAMVEAVRLLSAVDPSERATVVLVGAVDEEVGGTGAERLVDGDHGIDMAVVGEPTSLEMAVAHKGVLRFDIEVLGTPAHSSKPHLGVNAIHAMSRVLDALEHEYIPRLADNVHPLVGQATLAVTTIKGGTAHNVVPARCVISLDRRVSPGESHERLLAEFDELLEGLRAGGLDIVRNAPYLATSAVDTPPDHRIVRALGEAREAVVGVYGSPTGMTYGTDGSFFAPAGIPCVIFGPGSIDQAHSDEEWVEIEETAQAAEILAELAVRLA